MNSIYIVELCLTNTLKIRTYTVLQTLHLASKIFKVNLKWINIVVNEFNAIWITVILSCWSYPAFIRHCFTDYLNNNRKYAKELFHYYDVLFNHWLHFSATATMEPLTLILAVVGWVLFFLLAVFYILTVVFIIKKRLGMVGVYICLQHFLCCV